jgi:hypothetical protein
MTVLRRTTARHACDTLTERVARPQYQSQCMACLNSTRCWAYPTGEHSNEPLCGSTGVVNAAVGAAAARCPLLPQRLCLTRSESGKIGL